MVNWDRWDPWKALWNDWTRLRAEKDLAVSHIQFLDLYNFFRRQVKALGIDPATVDVRAYLDPALTYQENKTILAEVMQIPPTTDEYESMYESYKQELTDQVKEKYPEVVAEFEKKIRKLERETEQLPRERRAKTKWKKLAESLRFDLEETERRHEEEKRALEQKVAPVKLRILKAFTEGIIDYRVASVIETRNIDWAMSLVEKGFAERVAAEVAVEIAPPPKELTDDEKKQLADVFKAVLFKELGKVPANALAVFRVELEQVKMTPYEEAKKTVESLAQEIITKEALRKIVKVAKPPRPPPRIIRPPPIRDEMPIILGRIPPAYPPKEPDPEAVPFPRAPSSKERMDFEKAFRYRLQERGINYMEFLKQFEQYIAGTVFKTWEHMLKSYELFVDAILKGEKLPPLRIWQGVPISYGLRPLLREEPDERKAFREVLEDYRYNSVVKAATVVLKNAKYLQEIATLETIMATLDEQYGITGLTNEDIRDILTHAWKNKEQLPVPWFTTITLEDLNGLF